MQRLRPGPADDAEAAALGDLDALALGKALERQLRVGGRYFVPPGKHLDRFLAAVKRHADMKAALIRSRGRLLLKREIVEWLNRQHHYDFRVKRLIHELRQSTGVVQPTRFSRERVPVFQLSPAVLPI